MTYTATTIAGQRLEARLEPWLDPAGDLARVCDALGQTLQPVLELAEESGEDGTAGYVPAWGKLLDPTAIPAVDLPYLGQYVGVEVSKGASEAEARAAVKREAGLERGTLRSVEEAIKSVLGAEPFTLQERTALNGTEAAYHFNVIVGTGKATAALSEAIEAVTPAGVFFSVIEGKGMWLQATKKWSEVGAAVKWPEAEGKT